MRPNLLTTGLAMVVIAAIAVLFFPLEPAAVTHAQDVGPYGEGSGGAPTLLWWLLGGIGAAFIVAALIIVQRFRAMSGSVIDDGDDYTAKDEVGPSDD